MTDRLGQAIEIRFNFGNAVPEWMDCKHPSMDSDKLSRVKGRAIELNPHLLGSGEACRHKDISGLMKAEIVHRLAEIYDQKAPTLTSEEQQIKLGCEDSKSRECTKISTRHRFLSDRESFMRLTNFEQGPISQSWTQKRQLFINGELRARESKVYDDRELVSSQKTLSVAMERFVLSPTFGCLSSSEPKDRRPALAWYLHRHFGTVESAPECLRSQAIPLDLVDDKTNDPFWISSDEIISVHIGWASPGKGLLSRWGHIMLILITDEGERIAINFHANMNGKEYGEADTKQKLWDGLTGEHVAKLMPSRLETQIADYVLDEKRQLLSWPLKLSDDEKTQILYHVFENFAYYRGTWKHLSSNCVSHFVDFFRVALPERALLDLPTEVLTPAGVVEFFNRDLRDRLLDTDPQDWKHEGQEQKP